MARISVLLPQPDGPATRTTSPDDDGQGDVADRRLGRATVAEGQAVDLDQRPRTFAHGRNASMRMGASMARPKRSAADAWLIEIPRPP